ncbi:hypothetical protein SLEP1_g32025 [Rubroshorea leprosula]|uniref:Cation-transporting P-type ATPase N-terminal domain-containing protein n=1 Tax=Rubroshorea leprosula TaxID=152421 RepID=A0AAV5KC47_9ROSI|nr:hypothetical protein SLEP1_g32025 [Rubroshorea leprosula]
MANSQFETADSSRTLTLNKSPSFSLAPCIDRNKLAVLVKEKDSASLYQLGGVEGVATALRTESENGIRDDAEEGRKRQDIFGSKILCSYQRVLLHYCLPFLLQKLPSVQKQCNEGY